MPVLERLKVSGPGSKSAVPAKEPVRKIPSAVISMSEMASVPVPPICFCQRILPSASYFWIKPSVPPAEVRPAIGQELLNCPMK